MKKILLSVIAVAAALTVMSCAKKEKTAQPAEKAMRIAMITDYGDITDQSFNQTTYQACKEYAESAKLDFKYYKPSGDSTEARVSSINAAIQDEYNVLVLPGFAFAEALVKTADDNSDVTFIALDVGEFDIISAAEGLGKANYQLPKNAFSAVYAEEIPGYLAGYAAAKEGYTHLGFLGGMSVPAVIRYGYGFVQGVNDAAVAKGNASDVTVEYVYGGQFYGDQTITAAMDGWYQQRGVEAVFACGGGIWTSACEAAAKTNGKVIGVDVDQSGLINKYGEGMCVTSAMKGLSATVKAALKSIQNKTFDAEYAGKISTLGLVSGTDLDSNFVGLPLDTWTLKNFSTSEYKTLVNDIFTKKVTVSNSTGDMPATAITVNAYANIK